MKFLDRCLAHSDPGPSGEAGDSVSAFFSEAQGVHDARHLASGEFELVGADVGGKVEVGPVDAALGCGAGDFVIGHPVAEAPDVDPAGLEDVRGGGVAIVFLLCDAENPFDVGDAAGAAGTVRFDGEVQHGIPDHDPVEMDAAAPEKAAEKDLARNRTYARHGIDRVVFAEGILIDDYYIPERERTDRFDRNASGGDAGPNALLEGGQDLFGKAGLHAGGLDRQPPCSDQGGQESQYPCGYVFPARIHCNLQI